MAPLLKPIALELRSGSNSTSYFSLQKFLALFLYHLNRRTDYDGFYLGAESISVVMETMMCKYMAGRPTVDVKDVMMLHILLKMDVAQFPSCFYTYLFDCLQKCFSSIKQSPQLASLLESQHGFILKNVTLISYIEKPPLFCQQNNYNQKERIIIPDAAKKFSHHTDNGQVCSTDHLNVASYLRDESFVDFCKDRDQEEIYSESIMLVLRIVNKSIDDSSQTSDCKDIQITSIIAAAAYLYNNNSCECIELIALDILSSAICQVFGRSTVEAVKLIGSIRTVWHIAVRLVCTAELRGRRTWFYGAFLFFYTINNLWFSKMPSLMPADLYVEFTKCEQPMKELITELAKSSTSSRSTHNLWNLLMAIYCNVKGYNRMMRWNVASKRMRRILRKNSSVHHPALLGDQFNMHIDCLLESLLLSIVPTLNAKRQTHLLQVVLTHGICCCNITYNNLQMLSHLVGRQQTKVTQRCLNLIKKNVYHLLHKRRNNCSTCKMAESDRIFDELCHFYATAIVEPTTRQQTLFHILNVFKSAPHRLQGWLLSLVWEELMQEKDETRTPTNIANMTLCLRVIIKASAYRQWISVIFNADLINILCDVMNDVTLMGLVCEIICSGLKNAEALEDGDVREEIRCQLVSAIISKCISNTELAFLFVKEKVSLIKNLSGEDFKDILKSPEILINEMVEIVASLQKATILWNALAQIIQSEANRIYINCSNDFYTENSIFILVYMCLVFVLDVPVSAEDHMYALEFQLIDLSRFKVEANCDKYKLMKCDYGPVMSLPTSSDTPSAHKPIPVLTVAEHLSYDDIMQTFDRESNRKFIVSGCNKEEEPASESTKQRRSSTSSLLESLRTATETINHFVFDHLMNFIWRSDASSSSANPPTEDQANGKCRKVHKFIGKVEVTKEIRLKVGQWLEAMLTYFVLIGPKHEFGKINGVSVLRSVRLSGFGVELS